MFVKQMEVMDKECVENDGDENVLPVGLEERIEVGLH